MRKKSEENFLPGSQFVRIGVPLITERKFTRLAIQSSVRTGKKYLTAPCEEVSGRNFSPVENSFVAAV